MNFVYNKIMEKYFSVKNLSFGFDDDFFVLNNINFEVEKGEKILVLASKEKGKTAFLGAISSFFNIKSGNILLNGKDLNKTCDREKNFSFLPSQPVFFENKSVFENFKFFEKNYKLNLNLKEKLDDKIKTSNLKCKNSDKMKRILQFDKRILAIFRSELKNPSILFLDNQFTDLENEEKGKMADEYEKILSNEDLTVFYSMGEDTYNYFLENNKNLIFNKIFYIFDANLYIFSNFDEFRKNIFNINQFNFIPYKNKISGYIYYIDDKFYLKTDLWNLKLDEKFYESLKLLNLDGDVEEVDVVSKTKNIKTILEEEVNILLNDNSIYLFSVLGGDNIFNGQTFLDKK